MNDYSKSIGAKVSNAEYEQIVATAKLAGLTKSEFVRIALAEKIEKHRSCISLDQEGLVNANSPAFNTSEINCRGSLNYSTPVPSSENSNFESKTTKNCNSLLLTCCALSIISLVIYKYS